jgi:hypothetical protein
LQLALGVDGLPPRLISAAPHDLSLRRTQLEFFMRTVLEKYRSSMNPAERDIVRKFVMEPRLRLPFMLSGLLAGSMVAVPRYYSLTLVLSCGLLKCLPWLLCRRRTGWQQQTLHPRNLCVSQITMAVQLGLQGMAPKPSQDWWRVDVWYAGAVPPDAVGLWPWSFVAVPSCRAVSFWHPRLAVSICLCPSAAWKDRAMHLLSTSTLEASAMVCMMVLVWYSSSALSSHAKRDCRSSVLLWVPALNLGTQMAVHLHLTAQVAPGPFFLCGSMLQQALLIVLCNMAHQHLFLKRRSVPLVAVPVVAVACCFAGNVAGAVCMMAFGQPGIWSVLFELGACIAVGSSASSISRVLPPQQLALGAAQAKHRKLSRQKGPITQYIESSLKAWLKSTLARLAAKKTKEAALASMRAALTVLAAVVALVAALALSGAAASHA